MTRVKGWVLICVLRKDFLKWSCYWNNEFSSWSLTPPIYNQYWDFPILSDVMIWTDCLLFYILTFYPLYKIGIGRADIEESKSDVAMNAWPPQASYPCGNFFDTYSFELRISRGSLSQTFQCIDPYWTSKSNQLLHLNSKCDFCSHWIDLRSSVLFFNRCAAPAKLPIGQNI